MKAISIRPYFLIAMFIILIACNIPRPSQPAEPTQSTNVILPTLTSTEIPAAVTPDHTLIATETETPSPETKPTETQAAVEIQSTQPSISALRGFVVFNESQKEFQGFDFTGKPLFRYASSPVEPPSPRDAHAAGNNVYFYASIDQKIFRSNQSGMTFLPGIPGENMTAFLVSPDEQRIAWTITDWFKTPVVSTLWAANIDGSAARQVASFNDEQTPAFYLVPLEWTSDGQLIFERGLTGFGGYILYAGHNSLYAYNPANNQITTYVPAEELNGLCLDSYRLDLSKVVFICGQSGPAITIRNLSNGTEQYVPTIVDYPAVGSAHFSPSGQWLAYGAARSIPENEGGLLMLVPTDLGSPPVKIASVEGGFFTILAWIDENTLIVARNDDQSLDSTIVAITRDGSQSRDLAKGWFIDMLP